MLTKTVLILALFAGLLLAVPTTIWAMSQTVSIAPGDTLLVTCTTQLTGSIGAQSAQFDCAKRGRHR